MTSGFHFVGISNTGVVRSGNEDAGLASHRVLAVADGMGGHAAGEVASAAVIKTVADNLESVPSDREGIQRWILDIVNDAHAFVGDLIAADADRRGMGTTFSAVVISDNNTLIGHIGDSRVYRLRDGQLQQLTKDHTYVQMLVDSGEITSQEATVHPRRNLLMRAIDGIHEVSIDIDVTDLRQGDRFLLCSDGLTGVVSDGHIRELLGHGDLTYAGSTLIDFALAAGAPDNVTVVIGEFRAESADAQPMLVGSALDTSTTEAPAHPLKRWRRFIPFVAAGLLLVAAGAGIQNWFTHQWFVGSNGDAVAIYHGIPQQLGPLTLSSVFEVTTVPLSSLSGVDRISISEGVIVDSEAAARFLIKQLQSRSTLCSTSPLGCA